MFKSFFIFLFFYSRFVSAQCVDDTMAYDNSHAWWRLWITNHQTGRSCFVRFSPVSSVKLKTAEVRFSGYNRSESDIRVMILDQNQDSLGIVDVPFAQLRLGAWNTIDLSALNLTVDHDFYIGVGLISSNETDSLWISGDEGPGQVERSFVRYSKTWYDANSDYKWNLNMMIRATVGSETGVNRITPLGLSDSFILLQNYPNPFNPVTHIDYRLANATDVELTIYNSLGQTVKTLVNQKMTAGKHSITWNGMNEAGQMVTSGTYFYKIKAGDFVKVNKMILLK